jgi:hypothetical protein
MKFAEITSMIEIESAHAISSYPAAGTTLASDLKFEEEIRDRLPHIPKAHR